MQLQSEMRGTKSGTPLFDRTAHRLETKRLAEIECLIKRGFAQLDIRTLRYSIFIRVSLNYRKGK